MIMLQRTGLRLAAMHLLFFLGTGLAVAQQQAIDYERGTLILAMENEPPQLDSTKATDQVSGRVLGHVMEGLLRYDTRNRIAPGVAERWEANTTGAIFYLRRNALWSDGKPVTAHDFVFAWQTAVKPETASEYAFILYPLKNAKAINQGELPPSALGVRAVDDYTLKVEFEGPISYFDKLVAFPTYYPIREDFHKSRQGRYGADSWEMLYNGPFKIVSWIHGASLAIEKNEHYWDRDNIRLNRIDWAYITPDTNTRLNLFKDNQIATAPLDSETMKNALQERLRIRKFNDGALFFLEFNHRPERLTRNLHLRRAIQLAFDPYEFAYQVVGIPGTLPGISIFPMYLKGQHRLLRQEKPAPPVKVDRDKAREYLARAKRELGITGEWPAMTLLIGDSPTARKQAEYLQSLFQRTLGLTFRIDAQIFKQRLAKMTAGEFDLVAAGWGPDFDDPLTFADLFASWNLNNRGRYKNAELDGWIREVQMSLDPAERVALFGKIQAHLHEQVVLVPSYERTIIYVQHPQLQGMVRRVVGADPDYSRAWLTPPIIN